LPSHSGGHQPKEEEVAKSATIASTTLQEAMVNPMVDIIANTRRPTWSTKNGDFICYLKQDA
jgi:hypothetical protein